MNDYPKVSVIIPVYNSASFLPDVFRSLEKQTLMDFEAILIDDGSNDHILDILPHGKPWFSYYHQENQGPCAARNYGIQLARGEYMVFLDADDWISADKLETQSRFLDRHPEVSVVYSDGYLVQFLTDGEEKWTKFSKAGLLRKTLGTPTQNIVTLSNSNAFPIHAAMVRSRAVIEIGGFDENSGKLLLEDWDLWYRIGEKHQFAFFDASAAFYRVVETSRSKQPEEKQKASLYIEKRIHQNEGFRKLNSLNKSRSYASFGLSAIQFGNTKLARHRFLEALRIYPFEFRAWTGIGLTLLGDRLAEKTYHLLEISLNNLENYCNGMISIRK